jgi:outer membrane protein OmpA-like peptidoglycan-associated protein
VKVDEKGCPVKEVIKEIDKTKEVTADQIEVQKDIKVDAVHFVSGKYYLTDYSKALLDKLVQTLKSNPAYNVNAFGYTDSQGSDESNIKLSQNRVASVIEYLVSKGISDKRIIQQKAFGKADPVATNATPEGRLLNRRVEFEIFKLK